MSEQKTAGAGGAYGGQDQERSGKDHKPITSAIPERKEGSINPSAPNDIVTTERSGAERSREKSHAA